MIQKVLRVEGRFFEDTIDGYFPVQDSLRQMLDRNGFGCAFVSICHAPMMDLPGVARDGPVPLRLASGAAGTIRRLRAFVVAEGTGIALRGVARWSWLQPRPTPDRAFSPDWRLAEPAFLRGFGLALGEVETAGFGRLAAGGPDSGFAIVPARGAAGLGAALRLWVVGHAGILPETGPTGPCLFGDTADDASGDRLATPECVALIGADGAWQAAADLLARDD